MSYNRLGMFFSSLKFLVYSVSPFVPELGVNLPLEGPRRGSSLPDAKQSIHYTTTLSAHSRLPGT
jgi:hypothetical protein